MRELKTMELDAVSGGDIEFDGFNGKGPTKPKPKPEADSSTLDEVVAYGRRFFGSWRVRIVGLVGAGGAAQVVVDKAIDNNGNPIEEVVVVAEKIDDSDVPPANVLFGPGISPSERLQYWGQALENMSSEELNLLAKDMDALKADSVITAALDNIITQVQTALTSAAKMPSDQRGNFAQTISWNIGQNTTMINWGGLKSWWGPR
jgi:hypothetical protein